MRQFKPRFTQALAAALAAYPETRINLGDKAITLHAARQTRTRLNLPSSAGIRLV